MRLLANTPQVNHKIGRTLLAMGKRKYQMGYYLFEKFVEILTAKMPKGENISGML